MKYALIIGNNKYYDQKLAQLKTPAIDSQALANNLVTVLCAFPTVFFFFLRKEKLQGIPRSGCLNLVESSHCAFQTQRHPLAKVGRS
jgi:hypothetical protein